jgi:hypothetical protein
MHAFDGDELGTMNPSSEITRGELLKWGNAVAQVGERTRDMVLGNGHTPKQSISRAELAEFIVSLRPEGK